MIGSEVLGLVVYIAAVALPILILYWVVSYAVERGVRKASLHGSDREGRRSILRHGVQAGPNGGVLASRRLT